MNRPRADAATIRPPAPAIAHNDLLIVPDYFEALRARGLDSLDGLFSVTNDESLSKPGLDPWRERLRLTLKIAGTERTFYLKRFRNPPAGARREVRRAGCRASSMAGLEWNRIHELTRDGIPCPRPVALGEEFHGRKERRSAVLTAAVPGDSLECWAIRWSKENRPTVRKLIPVVADLVARFHGHGYIHRDLYLSHIFYDRMVAFDESLHLIDLQRVMRPGWNRRRWIVKDLAALNYSTPVHLVSQTDRVRWLKHYLGLVKLDHSARRLLYRVVGKTQRMAWHDPLLTERWHERQA